MTGKTSHDPRSPRIWLLCGNKAGDNNQLLALATALGWSYEVKRMFYRPYELLVGRFGATLAGIDRNLSDRLSPPWPNLILTAGRRNEPVALWIRKQAARSGLSVKIVHVGRPWAPLDRFDLIVTTPQYHLPEATNVLYLTLPLHRLTNQVLQEAADAWRAKIRVPPPYIAVAVGGDSGPYAFDRESARSLGRAASELANQKGAALLVTTSARTADSAVEALERAIEVPAQVFRWRPGVKKNPYLGFLALADEIIVTGDSMSMLAEACATGKPVHIFPFGSGRYAMRPEKPLPVAGKLLSRQRLRALRGAIALTLAPSRLRRDIRRIHQALIRSGRAAWLGEGGVVKTDQSTSRELDKAAEKIRELLSVDVPIKGHG